MKQMNANITSMRGDLNNLVVENVSEHGSDISLSELNNEVDSPRHDTETISIDTKVERLLKETSGAQTSEDSSANPDSLLTTIAQELDVSEQMGAAVHSGLAPIVDGLLGSKLSDEKWREKVGKYPRPQNLGNLRTPRVNPLIWNQLSSGVRTNDAKQQKIQHALFGAIIAMTKAADYIVQNGNPEAALLTSLTDGIALALQCQHDICQARRIAMKKDLHTDYQALCNVPIPIEEFLFGDLSKHTKDIADANKLTKKVRPFQSATRAKYSSSNRPSTGQFRRNHPYQRRENFRFHNVKKKKEGAKKQ
jgi:hypothetical protein